MGSPDLPLMNSGTCRRPERISVPCQPASRVVDDVSSSGYFKCLQLPSAAYQASLSIVFLDGLANEASLFRAEAERTFSSHSGWFEKRFCNRSSFSFAAGDFDVTSIAIFFLSSGQSARPRRGGSSARSASVRLQIWHRCARGGPGALEQRKPSASVPSFGQERERGCDRLPHSSEWGY
jgi:hypothetical protein